jgi:hypothetical protein
LQNSWKWETIEHIIDAGNEHFFGPRSDEHTCKCVELPLIIATGPKGTFN